MCRRNWTTRARRWSASRRSLAKCSIHCSSCWRALQRWAARCTCPLPGRSTPSAVRRCTRCSNGWVQLLACGGPCLADENRAVRCFLGKPGACGKHPPACAQASNPLLRQVWRERLARQRAEAQLQLPSSRRSTQGEVDEATLERLQAEAQAADTLSNELQRAKVGRNPPEAVCACMTSCCACTCATALVVAGMFNNLAPSCGYPSTTTATRLLTPCPLSSRVQGHQLQLQQRLEALQLQLAKQSALLESASRGRPSPRRGGQSPASRSPCKETISLHNSLRVAEQRAEEAGVRLAGAEREVAALKRCGGEADTAGWGGGREGWWSGLAANRLWDSQRCRALLFTRTYPLASPSGCPQASPLPALWCHRPQAREGAECGSVPGGRVAQGRGAAPRAAAGHLAQAV